ncbi:MAG: SusD/RagB family nutrient-binding outer membrane lipoprotein [Tannerellaceae bacterium]|nr:SusD/RagB family nutrient-binding outer membrane lipoprotein [Tannerellaceae bacterium]
MKRIYQNIITTGWIVCMLTACTGHFEDMNTNPFGVTDEELTQDNNLIGMHFPTMQQSIYYNYGGAGYYFQTFQNLNADIWSGYMATPSNFKGGVNNQTYYLNNDWNDDCWNYTYNRIMSNQLIVKEKCEIQGMDVYGHFNAINSIIRVFGMSRMSDQYGPIIYSRYGETLTGGIYDSAEDTYKLYFKELTEAVDILNQTLDKSVASFARFDLAYGGKYEKWMKMANSLRLRLAMRIVKYDAEWARREAEAAIKAPQGVMGKDDSFIISGYGWRHPLYTISISYNDVFIGANIQSILEGYGDGRLDKYGIAKGDKVLGVRTGIPDLNELESEYKAIISHVNITSEDMPAALFTSAESFFLLAEAALRGWDAGGTAQQFYEEGILASFEQWGVSLGDYLNSSALPADWVDPLRADFNSSAVSQVSPRWEDATTDEERLEKIITQKWIAGFPEGMNAWAEWRRTGYPRLFPILKNDSQGTIPTDLGVRRLTYTLKEQRDNPEGYASAVRMLGGPDTGATHLFWDIDKPNL